MPEFILGQSPNEKYDHTFERRKGFLPMRLENLSTFSKKRLLFHTLKICRDSPVIKTHGKWSVVFGHIFASGEREGVHTRDTTSIRVEIFLLGLYSQFTRSSIGKPNKKELHSSR